ncbi:energy transducer TonB [Carboxylicivirga sp. RSCT41]|uniref:energy transducer TonB n=1 Tax=Carboxylicivirga agarovorans TaxID=3417570 RepID=UPI003D33D0E9
MKRIYYLFTLILLFGINSQAQDTLLLNQAGKITIKGFESFYRECNYNLESKKPEGEFNDYYAVSSNIYATGSYVNGKKKGIFSIYDINGKKNYSIRYNDNSQIDTITIYENGERTKLKFSEANNELAFYEFNDSLNNNLLNEGNGTISYNTTDFSIYGQVKNFRPNGDWEIVTPDFTIIEKFKKGVFISGMGKQVNGQEFQTVISNIKYFLVNTEYLENTEKLLISDFYRKRDYPKLHEIFTPKWNLHSQTEGGFIIVEDQAGFPGGKENLISYIQSKIVYPKEAQENNIKGTVIVSFTIDIDGQVKNPEIIKSLGYGCDEVALDIAHDMPDWIPGQQRGKPVPVTFKIPLRFE